MKDRSTLKAAALGAGAALVLAISGFTANAASVTVSSVTGAWSNVTGSPSSLSGVGSSTISWGQPASGAGQSSYSFGGTAPPTIGPYNPGDTFTLGTFTHDNNPIYGNPLTGATLNLTIIGTAADGATTSNFNLTSSFVFSHNETPNSGPAGCCDDIVTATTNVGGSQVINLNGIDYMFAFSGFLVGGQPLSAFYTKEGFVNTASIQGSFTTVPTAVPGPVAGAGLPMLTAFGGLAFWRRRQRRSLST